MIDTNSQTFKLAVQAAKNAVGVSGKYLRKKFLSQNHQILVEGTHEKIQADLEAENIILETLSKHLNTFSYISEETQKFTADEIQFIIDPIEGTSNYARGIPFFGTQIAIVYQKILAAAFIYEPINDVLYHTILGQGAYANKKKLHITSNKPLNKAVVSGGAGTSPEKKLLLLKTLEKLVLNIRSVRLYGSTGLELAYTAQGKLGVCVNLGSKIYDFAPGVLLVREAGGIVLNFKKKEWELNDSELIAGPKEYVHEILSSLNL